MAALDVVKMHHDGFNNRLYLDAPAPFIADSFVAQDMVTGMEFHGVDGYSTFGSGWIAAFPDARINVVSQDVSGGTVTTKFRGTGTFNGELHTPQGVVPGNGSSLDLEFIEECDVEGDRMVATRLSYDPAEMMRQLGLG